MQKKHTKLCEEQSVVCFSICKLSVASVCSRGFISRHFPQPNTNTIPRRAQTMSAAVNVNKKLM